MLQIILKIIGVLIILAGVILIYDSRLITKKFFGFGDQNEATIGMKLIGFIIAIIGAIVIFAVNRL
ncbi:unknown [Clostridium sp. CAG:440]|jgi:hypothetical protein|nr:unknown [Clostridium sp. CAG:440]